MARSLALAHGQALRAKGFLLFSLEVDNNLEFDSCFLPSYLCSFSFPSLETLNLFRRQDYFTYFLDILKKYCCIVLIYSLNVQSTEIFLMAKCDPRTTKKKPSNISFKCIILFVSSNRMHNSRNSTCQQKSYTSRIVCFHSTLCFTGLLTQKCCVPIFCSNTHHCKNQQIQNSVEFCRFEISIIFNSIRIVFNRK